MSTRDARAERAGAEFGTGATDSPAERGLCLAAMGGAAVGAFAAAILAAGTAGVLPALFGMLGAVSGSVCAAAAWSAVGGDGTAH